MNITCLLTVGIEMKIKFFVSYLVNCLLFLIIFYYSYERHYKGLLDHMVRNDLALRGTFDGVELLIFASNQLPEDSQRKILFCTLANNSLDHGNLVNYVYGFGVGLKFMLVALTIKFCKIYFMCNFTMSFTKTMGIVSYERVFFFFFL